MGKIEKYNYICKKCKLDLCGNYNMKRIDCPVCCGEVKEIKDGGKKIDEHGKNTKVAKRT